MAKKIVIGAAVGTLLLFLLACGFFLLLGGSLTGALGAVPVTATGATGVAVAAQAAGFTGERLRTAVAISLAETGGTANPKAIGHNGPTSGCAGGSLDLGAWQINNCYHPEYADDCAHPQLTCDPQSHPDVCAYDLACSAAATFVISAGGTNWQPWTTYRQETYRRYLDRADEAIAAASGITDAGSAGNIQLSTVSCPSGGSTTVNSQIASNLEDLYAAAAADGIQLCGGGYRSHEQQIQLRREHCGTSDYAIYQMPASQCSPPTAKPGSSMHEQGLAIDFTCAGGSVTRGSACYAWLIGHSADYGLHPLASEPWHFSTNGR
jgi:Lysozyme like domain/D-alanyl-D-alanine carboxypeptidase